MNVNTMNKVFGQDSSTIDTIATVLKIVTATYLVLKTIKTGVDLYYQIEDRKKTLTAIDIPIAFQDFY
ncbi:hypothetical protein [Aquimarina muelleri]|uniref:Uncharacterized protein n=1 Tax=Aquimarina muelleri TaxID=279356 RepID=A0A918K0F5_9FLAO|nr:hypothetical protein [Aquimarina muelleri]GGX36619.1 hypothetical protein GCM10007384_39860 [Aquimarina muelleri]